MKENLSPFTLFIKLFVHFLTPLLLQDALLAAGFHASRKRCRPQGVDGRRHLTVRRTEGVNLYTPPPHPPFPGEVVTLHACRFLLLLPL